MSILKNCFTYILILSIFCMIGCSKSSPTISKVSPKQGTTDGGTKITIEGTNFIAGTKVKVGKNQAVDVKVVSPTQITATTPNCSGACFQDITITTPSNVSVSLKEGFAYVSRMEIFVTNPGGESILVFGTDSSGDVKPTRTIMGDKTEIRQPSGIFIDDVKKEIFVAAQTKILVFDRSDTDNTPPSRIISGDKTKLDGPTGLFVDTVNHEIFSLNGSTKENNARAASITIFPKLEFGNVEPKRIVVDSGKSMTAAEDVFVDLRNDEVFVTSRSNNRILIFERNASGASFPKRTISGNKTRLNSPEGLGMDTLRNEIYVANSRDNNILVFDKSASGDVEPKRIIEGPNTQLRTPTDVFVDSVYGEVFVVNNANHSITVYKRDVSGNADPARVIKGDRTTMKNPSRIFVSGLPLELIHQPKLVKPEQAKNTEPGVKAIPAAKPEEGKTFPGYCSVCRGVVYMATPNDSVRCQECEDQDLTFCPNCGISKTEHKCQE